jgi:hypothetical protein
MHFPNDSIHNQYLWDQVTASEARPLSSISTRRALYFNESIDSDTRSHALKKRISRSHLHT